MKHSMEILQDMAAKNGPLCVGLDTDPSYIPSSVLAVFDSVADAVLTYNREIIKRIAAEKLACCFKIQIAYYEAMGISGLKAYAQTIRAVHEAGFLAISDVKRGDIADTASAYARAHFSGEFESDFVTVNPYMGFETLLPFCEFAKPKNGAKGIFVLLKTSNSGSADIEKQVLKNGELVLEKTGAELLRLNNEFQKIYPEQKCSPIGAVVGCTNADDAKNLREKYPQVFFLIPGFGAQGGAAEICATLLQKAGGVVNSSRAILCAWKNDPKFSEKAEKNMLCISDAADAAAKAALQAKSDLIGALSKVNF